MSHDASSGCDSRTRGAGCGVAVRGEEAAMTSSGAIRHERDYLERTIETVRNHRDADNCWPQWANIFADEIERLWAERDELRTALEAMRTLAIIADQGDPWYAEHEGLNAAAIYAQARAALGELR